jgi:hypothetical protein
MVQNISDLLLSEDDDYLNKLQREVLQNLFSTRIMQTTQ